MLKNWFCLLACLFMAFGMTGCYRIIYSVFHDDSSVDSPNTPSSKLSDKDQMLDFALSSSSDRSLDRALRRHGSVRPEEIPFLADVAQNGSKLRRKNAVRLLSIAKTVYLKDELKTVVRTESELPIWAIAVNSVCGDPELPELLQARPELATKALASDESEVLQAGLCAGMTLGFSDILQHAKRLIENKNADVRAAAIRTIGLVGDDAILPLLSEKLAVENDPVAFRALVVAIITRNHPSAEEAIRTFYTSLDDKNKRLVILNAIHFSNAPWRTDFLLELASGVSDWDRLPALFSLSHSPNAEFVEICEDILGKEPEKGTSGRSTWLSLAQPCQQGLEKLSGRKMTTHAEALAFARQWLKSQGSRH